MEILILLSLAAVLWLVSFRRWQRRFTVFVTTVLLVYLIITSSFIVPLTNWG